jgi:GntR family transcriptional regulator
MNPQPLRLRPDSRPLHDRAVDALDHFIESGLYKPGDKLPPEEALAHQLGISRSTLREALGNLEHHGVIIRRHGVGTFVTAPPRGHLQGGLEQLESFRSLAAKAGVNEERAEWQVELAEAGQEVADALALAAGTLVVCVQMTATIDKAPFAYLKGYVPVDYVDMEELRAYQAGSLLDYLTERDEPLISFTQTRLYAVPADQEAARYLQVAAGRPLLHLAETFYAENGQPISFALNYFITDQLDFHLVRRAVRR